MAGARLRWPWRLLSANSNAAYIGRWPSLAVDSVDEPLTELSRLAGQVLAWRDQIAELVNGLDDIRYTAAGAGTEQLRAEVALFERAMDRCAMVLGVIAKLDIDTRLARIDERRADAVVRAVEAGLVAAGVYGEPAQLARKAVARELRIAATAPERNGPR